MNRSHQSLPFAFLAALAFELSICTAMASQAEDAANRSYLDATLIDLACVKYFPVEHERVHEYQRGLLKIMLLTAEEERKARGKMLVAAIVAEIRVAGEEEWCAMTRDKFIQEDSAHRSMFPGMR